MSIKEKPSVRRARRIKLPIPSSNTVPRARNEGLAGRSVPSKSRGVSRLPLGVVEVSAPSGDVVELSLIHISEPTRLRRISYAVFCLKKKKKINHKNI